MGTLKLLIVTSILLGSLTSISAQADSTLYKVKIEQYQRMQRTGTIIAIAGSVVEAVGISMFFMVNQNDDFLIPASVVSGVGLATMIPGFILRGNGKRKVSEYKIKLNDVRTSFYYSPRHSGIRLTYRF